MKRSIVPPLFAAALFLCLSVLFIPYIGLQDDELLFTTPLYSAFPREFGISIFHHQVPLMLISYIGSLKTLLFAPIFAIFGASVWTARLPVVCLGALSVFLFYLVTERAAGRWAAFLGALLLATDPVFLLTNTVDWGPVALEHVFLLTVIWSLGRWAQSPATQRKLLVLGFAALGLALWNKAVFIWALGGLAVATL